MMNNQYPYSPQPNFVPPVIKPSGHVSAIKIVLGIAVGLLMLLLGLLVLLLIGFDTGPVGLLVGMICATIPVPIYVTLVLWIDRYEAEPLWLLATVFCWGAMVAVFIAYVLNTGVEISVGEITKSAQAAHTAGAVISAPIVEESAKALILFIIFFWKKDEFDGVIDGIVYASMVALGFAMTENIQYYGHAVLKGGDVLTVTLFIRGLIAPFSHPLFTSMTGIGLGLARQSTNLAVKLITPVVGLLMAMSMHAIWNGSGTVGGCLGFLVTYAFVMVPAFIVILVVIIFGLRREGRIVREFLEPEVRCGVLRPQEYEQLCSVFRRMGGSFDALTRGGMGHWRASRQFNQIGSELAFHRSRVARGILSSEEAAREREAAYLQLLEQLLIRLRAI
jgi:RsiW-degrading membrane proteinase PrsW (M82 family)